MNGQKLFPHLRLITISGLSAAGKDTITNLLAPQIGWPVLTISQIMRDHCKKIGRELPSDPDLEFNQQIENLIRHQIATAQHLVLASNRTAGYHAYHYLQQHPQAPQDTFSILITAPQEVRIQRLAQRDHLSPEAARLRLTQRDQIDLHVYQQLLGVNPLEPQYFDLVVDTSQHSPDQATELILKKLNPFMQ